jgi:lysophospholipase L1-like esterase
MLNLGIGGDRAETLLGRLQATLDSNPSIHFWAIGIGSNDWEPVQFERSLIRILEVLLENGKQPIFARIPYSAVLPDNRIQSLNAVIARLTEAYGLPAGPDLYGHFRQNPSQLRDGLHPTIPQGIEAIQKLWAQTACNL